MRFGGDHGCTSCGMGGSGSANAVTEIQDFALSSVNQLERPALEARLDYLVGFDCIPYSALKSAPRCALMSKRHWSRISASSSSRKYRTVQPEWQ